MEAVNNKFVDDDIDDIDNDNEKLNNGLNGLNGLNSDQDFEALLNSLGGLDEETMNKLAEMKDMSDLSKLDMRSMRKMFSKMNIDKSKLKSFSDKMKQSDESTNDTNTTPLTREELRKKLREKTQILRKTRTMK